METWVAPTPLSFLDSSDFQKETNMGLRLCFMDKIIYDTHLFLLLDHHQKKIMHINDFQKQMETKKEINRKEDVRCCFVDVFNIGVIIWKMVRLILKTKKILPS